MSLLAHCYYYTQDFTSAVDCYEKLIHLCPDEDIYKIFYAQCLHQSCMYQEAWTVCQSINQDNQDFQEKVKKLQASIKYSQDDIPAVKIIIEQCDPDDVDTEINIGCLLYKEGEYEKSLKKFIAASQIAGFKPHLSYNVALCYYKLKEYAASLKYIGNNKYINK